MSKAKITGLPKRELRELDKIRQASQDKLLHPENVVDAARSKASPLHKHFTWDDSLAAQQHRLWQARELIAQVVVVYNDHPPVRYLVRVTTERAGYRPLQQVMKSRDLSIVYLNQFVDDIRRLVEKYENNKFLIKHIGDTLARLKSLIMKLTRIASQE